MAIVNFKSAIDSVANAAQRKIDDVKRIATFMYGTPAGAIFIGKQVGLQLMNPKQESNGNSFFNVNSTSANRIYNLGANTMAQVAVQGTGIHFDRHGLLPINEERNKYYKVVAENDRLGKSRILEMYKKLIMPQGDYIPGLTPFTAKLNDDKIILSYGGGPDSFLGIGDTIIPRVYNTTHQDLRYTKDKYTIDFVYVKDDFTKDNYIDYTHQLNLLTKKYTRDQIFEITGVDTDRPFAKPAHLDRPAITNVIGKPLFRAYDSSTLTKRPDEDQYVKPAGDTRLKDSGIQYIERRINFESQAGDQFVDGINLINIYSSEERAKSPEEYDKYERDLVRFKFEIINNDNPNVTNHLVFRSYLHPIENSVRANWNAINYLGRGDSQYVYTGYEEEYALGFDIMAMSAGEMKPIYSKLNYLKSSLAPDYKGTKMRGNIVRLTIGNLLVRVPGIIPNLNISVPDESPWDIDIPATDSGDFAKELPRMLRVTFTFKPIYNHLIRTGRDVPFFSVDKLGYLEK